MLSKVGSFVLFACSGLQLSSRTYEWILTHLHARLYNRIPGSCGPVPAPAPIPAPASAPTPAPAPSLSTPSPASKLEESSSTTPLVIGGLAITIILVVLALRCAYVKSRGVRNGGRSTVHVASNEVEIVSQAERASGAQAAENQESDNDNNNEEEHDQREDAGNKSNQVIPASAASPAIAGSAGERSVMPARAANNNVRPPPSTSAMPVQQLGVRQNQRPAPFASALPMSRQGGAEAAPFIVQEALPTNATGLELNNSIPTNAVWPSASPSFGLAPLLQQQQGQQQQQQQNYGNMFLASASPMQQQHQGHQAFPSTTAQGARMQVPTWQNFQRPAQSSTTVINENPEDQRIFKTCQARVGAWKMLEINDSQVKESVLLGTGAYAEVFKGILFGRTDCAIKKYRSTASTRQLELAQREIRLTGGSCRLPVSLCLSSSPLFLPIRPISSSYHISTVAKHTMPAYFQHHWTTHARCAS